MKIFLTLLSLISFLISISQTNKYNTKIDKAKKVSITQSKVTINKADSVYINTHTDITPVYWKSSKVSVDSNGIYTTIFKFSPKVMLIKYDVNIALHFEEKFIFDSLAFFSPSFSFDNGQGMAIYNTRVDTANNFIQLYGTVYSREIEISVQSKESLHTTIYGVVGKLD